MRACAGLSRWLLAVSLVAANGAVVSNARAEGPIVVRVDYAVPRGCPDERAFVAAVRARTSRFEPAGDATAAGARQLRIRVEARESRVSGELVIEEPSAGSTGRTVSARTCTDVIAALALVAALTIDATTASPPSVPNAPPPAPPPPPPSFPVSIPDFVAPAQPPDADVEVPTKHELEGDLHVRYPAPRERPGLHVAVGAGFDTFAFGATGAVVAPSAIVEASYRRAGLFSPVVRLEALRTASVTLDEAAAKAAFTWTLGRAQLCPVRARFLGRFAWVPCLAIAAGALSAASTGIGDPLTPTRPWFAGDVEARLEWSVMRAFSLEVEGGAGVPFLRDTFVFQPSPVVYTPPAVYALGAVRAVLQFP